MLKQNENYSHFALAFILLADCLIREKRPPSGAINLQINSRMLLLGTTNSTGGEGVIKYAISG